MGILDYYYPTDAQSSILGDDDIFSTKNRVEPRLNTWSRMATNLMPSAPTPPPSGMSGPPPSTGSLPPQQQYMPSQQQYMPPQNASLTDEQKTLLATNMFGTLGAKLLAAGQKITPAQRAQYLSQLGEAAPDPNKVSEMILRQQQSNKMSRENAAGLRLGKLFSSPEFQQSIANMNPVQKAAFQGAMEAGDMATLQKIADDWMTVKITPQGDIYNPAQQTFLSGTLGTMISTDPKNAGTILSNGNPQTAAQSAANFDPTKYGMPEGSQVNPIFHQMPEAKQKQFSNFAMGKESTDKFGRNFWAKLKLDNDIQSVIPWYKPEEAQAAHSIYESFNDKKSPSSMYAQSRALNAALEHIAKPGGMLDVSKDLNQGQIQLINKFKNELNAQTGDPKVDRFLTLLHSLQSEVGKFIVNGKPPVREMEELDKQLNNAKSPEQIRAVLDGYVFLAEGVGDSADKTNMRLAGRTYVPEKMSLLDNKDTKELLTRYKNNTFGKEITPDAIMQELRKRFSQDEIQQMLGR